MRGGVRAARHEEDEESAFVSMTDMTVSFLFIVMILLAFFASQFRETDQVPRSELIAAQEELAQVTRERDEAREKVIRLEQLLRQARLQRDQAEQQARELGAALASAREELATARSDLAAARAAVAKLESELVEARRQVQHLDERVRQLEEKIRRLAEPDPLEEYLVSAAEARKNLLEELRRRIKQDFPDLLVEISAESDALRFQGEGLFAFNESRLRDRPRQIVENVAKQLNQLLPCYTYGPASAWEETCNPDLAVVEAVQIEGHTDDRGNELNNLGLSTARANETFAAMVGAEDMLLGYHNYRDQPVLSVAGYGEMRPIDDNASDDGRRANRRIDLRIIMHTPFRSEELDRIGERLRVTGGAAE